MKIAEVVSTFPPYKAGMGNVAFNLSWQLQALGHQVTVFTPTATKGEVLDHLYPFKVSRMRPWIQYGNAGFLPQLLWRLRGFDIVHLHYPFFGGAEMIYILDHIVDIKVVIHYHMDVFGQGLSERFFNWHSQQVMPHILDRADKIIVSSLDYAQRSRLRQRLQDSPERFQEIPFGVQADTFKPRRRDRDLEQKFQLAHKKVILFIGALDKAHYFKGVTYLIKAFQMISSNDDYRLMIIGQGDLSRSYQSLVSSFGLEKKVIFTGFVPDDLLPLYYNLGDIMVLPSIDGSEAFGMVLLEAMASGLPVIASDLPGVRSVVDKKNNGFLVKPRDIATLAKYLDLLLKNPHTASKFGQAGREKVLQRYNWTEIAKTTEKVFEDIIS